MAPVFLDSLFILFLQWHFMLICQMYGYQARVLNNVTTTKSSVVQSTLRPVDGDSTDVLINIVLARALGVGFGSILMALLGYFLALCFKYRTTADITDKLRKSYKTNVCKNKASFGCCYDHCLCCGLRGVYKIFFSQCECSCYCKSNLDDHERLLSIKSYNDLMLNDDICQSIKYEELMEMCNHYGKYDIKHKNFCYFASCKNNGHSEFLIRKGFQMIPIIYYFVLDWNDSEIQLLGSEEYNERDIDVIRVITKGEPPKRATQKTKMFKKVEAVIQILQESKKSICIVLLDFPATMQSKYETALNFVFNFINHNNIRMCYKCKRPSPSENDNVGESSEFLDSPTPKDIRGSLIAVESKVEKKDNIPVEMLPTNQEGQKHPQEDQKDHDESRDEEGTDGAQAEDDLILSNAKEKVKKYRITDGNVSHIMRRVTSLDLPATRKENEIAFDRTDAVMGNKLPDSVAGMGEEKHANRSSDIDEKKKRIEEIKEMRIKDLPGSANIGNSLNVDKKVMKLSRCYPCLNAQDLKHIVAAATGGGDPAYVFMQTLHRACSERTIGDFREILEENKELFSNALKVLKNYEHQDVLYDITDKDLHDIASALTVPPNSALPAWKCVAEYFELNHYVAICENAISQGNQYSQFDQLFNIIKTKIPSHTINEFIENLESQSLMDVVFVVNEQIEIKAKRDIKRNKK